MAGDAQAALLAHIASQTKSNINFLISQNYISPQDVEGLTAKLTALEDSPRRHNNVQPIAERNRQSTMNMNGGNSDGSWQGRAQSPPRAVMPTRRPVPPPQTRPQQARALWDYGDSSDSSDLTFRAGDIIDIVEETSPEWWTGKLNGRQGLLPSNYVEKIPAQAQQARAPSPAVAVPIPVPPQRAGSSYSTPSSYAPSYSSSSPQQQGRPPAFPSPGPGTYSAPPPGGPGGPGQWGPYGPPPGPPPPSQSYNGYGIPGGPPPPAMNEKQGMYGPPQQQPPPPPPQEPPQQEQKKSRFGGLGNTLAQSAVGGVGFGAGSAIGSGIIDAIF